MRDSRSKVQHSEEHLRKLLQKIRWPNGVECPRCQSKKISRIEARGQFDCDQCRYQFSAKVGTFLERSHIPLKNWFVAMHCLCESPDAVSSNQLKRDLGVSYKTRKSISACIQCERDAASADSSTERAAFFERFKEAAQRIHQRFDVSRNRQTERNSNVEDLISRFSSVPVRTR